MEHEVVDHILDLGERCFLGGVAVSNCVSNNKTEDLSTAVQQEPVKTDLRSH